MVQILLITLLIVYLVIAIYKLAGYGSFPEDYNSKDKILMYFYSLYYVYSGQLDLYLEKKDRMKY